MRESSAADRELKHEDAGSATAADASASPGQGGSVGQTPAARRQIRRGPFTITGARWLAGATGSEKQAAPYTVALVAVIGTNEVTIAGPITVPAFTVPHLEGDEVLPMLGRFIVPRGGSVDLVTTGPVPATGYVSIQEPREHQ